MSEWDDKINKLLVEVDALDDNPDKSALDALWLKVLTIATGVDVPSAERLGELVNDVLDSYEFDVAEQSSDQIDDIFNKLESLPSDTSNDQIDIIWTEFLHVMLGDRPRVEDVKQLVYCTLMPMESSGAREDVSTEIDESPNNQGIAILLPPEPKGQTSQDNLSQEDEDIIQEAEAALKAISSNEEGDVWPKMINRLDDDEIISVLNRLFDTYGIDAHLQNVDELRNIECFELVKGKLNVAPWCELRDNYKTSWSIVYAFYLKSKATDSEESLPEQQDEPEQAQRAVGPATLSEPSSPITPSASEDNDLWPKHINRMSDEDIVAIFNRLFVKFQISASLSVTDLREETQFKDMCLKLGSPEKCKLKSGHYQQSWNYLYKFFVKDKNLVFYFPQSEPSTADEHAVIELNPQLFTQHEQPLEVGQPHRRGRRSYIKGYKGYLRCARKHLDACKTIMVAHDSILHEKEDSDLNSLVYEEMYYLSGYIMECSTMAALLKIIDWSDGDELNLLDNDEHEQIRETYHISWDKNFYGCHRLSSHFAGKKIVELIRHNNQLATLFQDIPFLNGKREEPFNGDNDIDNLLCHEIFSDCSISERVEQWNNTVIRYRGLPFGEKRITRRDTLLLIALCDLIVKKIIQNFHINLGDSSNDDSLNSVNDSFQKLVSSFINVQQNNNSI